MPRLDDVTVPPGVGTGLIAGRVTRPAASGVLMAVFGPAHAQQQMPVLVPWASDGTPPVGSAVWADRDDRGQLVAIGVPGGAPVPYDTSPIGSVMTWSGRSNPSTEYALANGQTLSRDDFPDGYDFAQREQALGNPDWTTTSTTFTVPNYVGRFLFHRDVDAQGFKSGAKTVTLTVPQLPSHAAYRTGGTDGWAIGTTTAGPIGASVGGNQSHNNMPPYVAVAMFVKVTGVTVSAGAIVGPRGADGRDGAPGGATGYHVSEPSAGCVIPSTGPAGPFLVRGDLIVASSGGYYAAVDIEISSGGAPLWTGTLSACDLGTNLPMAIAIPEAVVTLGSGADLTLSAYPSMGYVTESRLTALAFHALT